MRKTIIIAAALALTGMGFATAHAEDAKPATSPATQMASFEACMTGVGFVKDTDFQTRLNKRTVAGSEVVTSYSARVQGYVIRTPDLLAKANDCASKNGHSNFA